MFFIFLGLIIILSLALLTSTFKPFKISHSASVSVISGILQIVASSSVNIAAGIKATVAFFAPLILIVPESSFLPSISIIFIVFPPLKTYIFYY